MAKDDDKYAAGVKCERFEVLKIISGRDDNAYQRYQDLAAVLRRVCNTLWRLWVSWHEERDSFRLMEANENRRLQVRREFETTDEYLKRREKRDRDVSSAKDAEARSEVKKKFGDWVETQKQKLTKDCKQKIDFYPNELGNKLYHDVSRRYGEVHLRTLILFMNRWRQTLTALKDGMPNWAAIFLGRVSIPSANRPQPIPFDTKNSKLVPIETDRGLDWHLQVRLTRDGSGGVQPFDTLILKTQGNRKLRRLQAVARNCFDGTFKFCGSSLVYDDRKNKWYAMISYKRPKHAKRDIGELQAVVRPGQECPVEIVIGETVIQAVRYGRQIAAMRRHVFGTRRSLLQRYGSPSPSQKGHGRNRSMQPKGRYQRLERQWNDFCKRQNHSWVNVVLRICEDRGVGCLKWEKPDGPNYCSEIGKDEEFMDQTTWQWFQFESFLAYKCQDVGIELVKGSGNQERLFRRSGGVQTRKDKRKERSYGDKKKSARKPVRKSREKQEFDSRR